MPSLKLTRLSLRTKMILLALVPAAAFFLVNTADTLLTSSLATSRVQGSVVKFMTDRSERSLQNSSRVVALSVRSLTIDLGLEMNLAQVLIGSRGGIALAGGPVPHAAAGDAEHMGGVISMPAMKVGSETITMGRSQLMEDVGRDTVSMVTLFQRVGRSNDLMRISSNLPAVQLGSFLSNESPEGGASPAATVCSGNPYTGRFEAGGRWYFGRFEPLYSQGEVIGALYLGRSIDGLIATRDAVAANTVGNSGSVGIYYAHGASRGREYVAPTGIAAATRSVWLPQVMKTAGDIRNDRVEGTDVVSKADKSTAIVRWTYLPKYDWIVVNIADLKDMHDAGSTVEQTFHSLLYRSLLIGTLLLIAVAVLAWLISFRLVERLQDITIQLTSNGTQVASSVSQQMAHATNVNVSSTEIATAVKEISATSQDLLRTMEELNSEAAGASSVAQQGSTGLQGLTDANTRLSEAAQKIENAFASIRDQAGKINSVTSAVAKVADQTNLLSLNAAIEAEKAGEAGAGFAVVAREIRRLADQSAGSSQQIEGTIGEMSSAMATGLGQVEALALAVQQSVELSQKIQEQFGRIIARVENMTPRYQMVHLGMQNQAEGAKQISEAMWQLTESAGQTAEATAELNEVSAGLHRTVAILKQRIFAGDAAESEEANARYIATVGGDGI